LVAKKYNVSDLVIGLTIVAVGTSFPELVTSIVAATKKNSHIAIGNVNPITPSPKNHKNLLKYYPLRKHC